MTSKKSFRQTPTYENRLARKLDKKFLKALPLKPGTYSFLDKNGKTLYIGQSANLRNKLQGYAGAGSEMTSAAMMRLLHQTADIQWEKCASVEEAIKRKKELEKEHKPSFSDLHKRSGNFPFIGFSGSHGQLIFELSADPGKITTDEYYGAFSSPAEAKSCFGALLRLFWMINEQPSELTQIPMALMRDKPPDQWKLVWDKKWDDKEIDRWAYRIKRFLKGTAESLIPALRESLDNGQDAPIHFMKPMIQNDLRQLQRFYRTTARWNYELSRYFKVKSGIVPPHELAEMQALITRNS